MSGIDIKQETEWLHEFSEAHRNAMWAIGILSAMSEDLRNVGMDGVAKKFDVPVATLRESVQAMDDAISRMVNEDFQRSMKTTDETFRALLRSVGATIEGTPSSEKES